MKEKLRVKKSIAEYGVSIGDGSCVSFWFDHWPSKGPLIDHLGQDGPRKSGLTLHSTVKDACGPSGWKLPSVRSRSPLLVSLRQILLATNPPSSHSGPDVFYWESGNVSRKTFTTSHTWKQLRPSAPVQPWAKLVWFKGNIPKLAFTFWISHLDRLPTKSRLHSWGISTNALCCTCSLHRETRDHLLLHCDFSEQIWKLVLHRLGQPSFIFLDWSVLISWLSSTSVNVSLTLKRVASQATIYMLWKERNNRLHNGISSTVSSVFSQIDRKYKRYYPCSERAPCFL
ncbi:unnamed protein product [Arabidopsis halleri]